ncbi:MAG TPA: hypothetical protein VG713_13390, partial [Pirellulales bacterium]|nr:hypothetical protein [Pirellulales bacterium]
MTVRRLAFTTTAVFLCASAAIAQPRSTVEDSVDLFQRFDVNGDGVLSLAEIGVWSWARYDVNGDDVVSQSEFVGGRTADRGQAAVEPDLEKAWKLLDWNNDGMLSGTELDGKWSKYDTNGDGRVSKDEFTAGRRNDGPKPPQQPAAPPLAPPAPPSPPGSGAKGATPKWSSIDDPKLGFSFAMPAEPTQDEQGMYLLVTDNGNTVYKLTTGEADEDLEANSKQRLDAVRDAEVEALKGKLVADAASDLNGHPGRTFVVRQEGQERFDAAFRVFLVGKRIIEMIVIRGAASTATEDTMLEFFNSLKLSETAQRPVAAGEVTFGSVVDAVAADDPARLLAQMHPTLRGKLDYPMA